jgi:hypothetical protein
MEDTKIRVFSIEEVDAMVPKLNALVGAQLARQATIDELLDQLTSHTGTLPSTLGPEANDSDAVTAIKGDLRASFSEYKLGWDEIQALGAIVKDPKTGLLDFYGRIDGKLVWLCWRYGETELGYYHDLDAGFTGRRALAGATRDRLLN